MGSGLFYYVRKIFSGKVLAAAMALGTFVVMLLSPEPYLLAAERGFQLFTGSVLPTLVPFSFISSFLTTSGGAEILFKLLSKPSKRLFSGSGAAGYAFSLSLISGYPIGAKTVSELKVSRCITYDDVLKILAFTSTAGPLFILGTVGVKFLGGEAGGVILLTHIASTVLNGVLFGRGASGSEPKLTDDANFTKAFTRAISATANTALSVAVSMIVFNVAAELLAATKLPMALGKLLQSAGITDGGEAFMIGLVEMTLGCKMLSDTLPLRQSVPLISALVSFGGASVHMQSMYFLSDIEVKYSRFLLLKISQAIFAYSIAQLLIFLL